MDSTGLVPGNCTVITRGVTTVVAELDAETVRSNVPFARTEVVGLMFTVNPTTETGGTIVAVPLNDAPVSFRLTVCGVVLPIWICSGLLASFRKRLVETIWGLMTTKASAADRVTPRLVPVKVAAKAPGGVPAAAVTVNTCVVLFTFALAGV